MKIDKDTVVCISVASRPSNFGTTLHNAAYNALGLNYIYKSFGVSDLAGAVAGVRSLGIRGMSVSMPHKQAIIPLLDEMDEPAVEIGAVNTVVNLGQTLKGFNTDAYGAAMALSAWSDLSDGRVLLLGAGGAARAVLHALRQAMVQKIVVASRDEEKGRQMLQGCHEAGWISWSERNGADVDYIINCTSIGMSPDEGSMPVDLTRFPSLRGVMDVVLSPMTSQLVRTAADMGLQVIPGYVMSLHQAAEQFRLYTNQKAPISVMEAELKRLLQPAVAV